MTGFSNRILYGVNPKFPKLILQSLTEQVKDLTYEKSLTHGNVENSIRTSTQCWLAWDTWIAGIMHNLFISANNAYFHYALDHFDSAIQATKYGVGQEYKWHVDDAVNTNKLPRKLSMSLVLDSEFEGGELEIMTPTTKSISQNIKPGNICIFPSWVPHRVKPVTSGTRYSLVAWMNGPQFI